MVQIASCFSEKYFDVEIHLQKHFWPLNRPQQQQSQVCFTGALDDDDVLWKFA